MFYCCWYFFQHCLFVYSRNDVLQEHDFLAADPSLPLCAFIRAAPPAQSLPKPVSTQLRIINPLCGRCCCCTRFICLSSTQTTAGSLMIMAPRLAACQAIGHVTDLYPSLIRSIHHLSPAEWLHVNQKPLQTTTFILCRCKQIQEYKIHLPLLL